MNKYKVFNRINGKEGFCGVYYANCEIGACVGHIRSCGVTITKRLDKIPEGYRVEHL